MICAKWSNHLLTEMHVIANKISRDLSFEVSFGGMPAVLKGFVRFMVPAPFTMVCWNLIFSYFQLLGSVVSFDTSIVSASLLVYSHFNWLVCWRTVYVDYKYLPLMIRFYNMVIDNSSSHLLCGLCFLYEANLHANWKHIYSPLRLLTLVVPEYIRMCIY